ncbi:MAG TPA: hypothetical protein VN648_33750 [Candidatus Methylomirabilis sp.]|nr:hypothetical protein [Candidatus Methylomirabilis sp.]
MRGTPMPESLRLVIEHLNGVRDLNRYLRADEQCITPGAGVLRDLQLYLVNRVTPALERLIPALKAWRSRTESDRISWVPDSWKQSEGVGLALVIHFPTPLDPDASDPSVNLSAPESLISSMLRSQRDCCVRSLFDLGFGYTDECGGGRGCPFGKRVPWLEPDDTFNEQSLLKRIASEAVKIVRLEPEITQEMRSFLSSSSVRQPVRVRGDVV